MIRWVVSLALIALCFLWFTSFVVPRPNMFAAQIITNPVRIDSIFVVLDSLRLVRSQQPDPDSNPSKRIYAEEIFKYRAIDSLAAIYPVIQSMPDSAKLAKLDSVISLFVHVDSTDDKGKKTRGRILRWLEMSLTERKQRIKQYRFRGKVAMASRNELIAVVSQNHWKLFSGITLRQVVKKFVIGRYSEGLGATLIGYTFSTTAEFDDKLLALRGQYFESEVK